MMAKGPSQFSFKISIFFFENVGGSVKGKYRKSKF